MNLYIVQTYKGCSYDFEDKLLLSAYRSFREASQALLNKGYLIETESVQEDNQGAITQDTKLGYLTFYKLAKPVEYDMCWAYIYELKLI